MDGLMGSHVFFRSPPTPGRGGKMSVLARSVKYASRARSFSIRPRRGERASGRASERPFSVVVVVCFFIRGARSPFPVPIIPGAQKNKTEYLPQEFPCFRPRFAPTDPGSNSLLASFTNACNQPEQTRNGWRRACVAAPPNKDNYPEKIYSLEFVVGGTD